jgi:hypothetical protein
MREPANSYRFRRDEDGPLFVELTDAINPTVSQRPEMPAEVVPISPDTVSRLDELQAESVRAHRTRYPRLRDDVYEHGTLCECEMCETPLPTHYATVWSDS